MISYALINSTFNIVKSSEVEQFTNTMKDIFRTKFQKQLMTYIEQLSGGTKKISLKELSSIIQ